LYDEGEEKEEQEEGAVDGSAEVPAEFSGCKLHALKISH
jgi:hypothetical protein